MIFLLAREEFLKRHKVGAADFVIFRPGVGPMSSGSAPGWIPPKNYNGLNPILAFDPDDFEVVPCTQQS